MFKTYSFFCFLRVAFTLFPESGYIHPDEFFQGPEIVYGDLLDLKVYKSWEFTSLNPIRSIIFLYFITGGPCLLAKFAGIYSSLYGTTYFPFILLILPRLLMCCLSFILDYLIYKLCDILKQNPLPCLTLHASSYVVLVYLIRTFSNSLESLIYAVLLVFVFKLIKKESSTELSSVCYSLESDIKLYFTSGILISMGIFNRPTFFVYSLFPCLTLIILLHKSKYRSYMKFLSLILGILSASLCFIFLDTLYYNKFHYSQLGIYNLFYKICITPLNFILYNMDTKNLSIHGLHPLWLHLLVNVPLLFSPYSLCVILKYLKELFYSSTDIHVNFFIISFLCPLCLLSIIPHQEPRFIIPLLFPYVFLVTDIFRKKYYLKLWWFFNILCLLFYGFLHQGGIFPATSQLHKSLQTNGYNVVIFYKTYMPPRFLLGITKSDVEVHDYAGVDEKEFLSSLSITAQKNIDNSIIVFPEKIFSKLTNISIYFHDYELHKINYIFPHFSTEILPNLEEIINLVYKNISFSEKMYEIKKIFSICILFYKHE